MEFHICPETKISLFETQEENCQLLTSAMAKSVTLKFRVMFILRRISLSPEDRSVLFLPDIQSPTTTFQLQVPNPITSSVSDQECCKRDQLRFLRHMGIEKHLRVKIVRRLGKDVASYIKSNPNAVIFTTINITGVKLEVLDYSDYEEEVVRITEMESIQDEARPIPASKSSIQELEKMVFDDNSELSSCCICMEEIEVGIAGALRMPCSHIYHEDCIVEWLQNSHLCPLCRYEMPLEEE